MREVAQNYIFDLERVIDKSKQEIDNESKIEANYILETFAQNNALNFKKLKNSIIKKVETMNTTTKKINEPKTKKRRVVKYFIMSNKERLEIVKQITVTLKTNGKKEVFRNVEIFEEDDLIRLGYINEKAEPNYEHPIVKQLIPRK